VCLLFLQLLNQHFREDACKGILIQLELAVAIVIVGVVSWVWACTVQSRPIVVWYGEHSGSAARVQSRWSKVWPIPAATWASACFFISNR
jgi:hypothetical protein